MVKTLRQLADNSRTFLVDLITWFVDNAQTCPGPAELQERAREMRTAHQEQKPLGNPECEQCRGLGYYIVVRRVTLPRLEAYWATGAKRCGCAPPEEKKEN
jgi:hypothetical protein